MKRLEDAAWFCRRADGSILPTNVNLRATAQDAGNLALFIQDLRGQGEPWRRWRELQFELARSLRRLASHGNSYAIRSCSYAPFGIMSGYIAVSPTYPQVGRVGIMFSLAARPRNHQHH